MTKLLERLESAAGRRRELSRARRGHKPGSVDTRHETRSGFWARPNFYYFESLGEGRPAWLPLYPYPRMVMGQALNAFMGPTAVGWPAELGLDEPIWALGDWTKVVGQYVATAEDGPGAVLHNEHVLGGWLRGRFETSPVWDLVILPGHRLNRTRYAKHPTCYLMGQGFSEHYLAWGNDLWLGSTGLRDHLLVPAGAAQNPPERLQESDST